MKKRLISLLLCCFALFFVFGLAMAENLVFAFEETEYSLTVGKSLSLKPVLQGTEEKPEYTWESSETSIATVDKGKVLAKQGGSVEITCTATFADGKSLKASTKLRVIVPIQSIKADVKSIVLASWDLDDVQNSEKYASYTPKLEILPADASLKELEWTVADPYVAMVLETGEIRGSGYGKTTVTGKAKDGSGKSVSIKVEVPMCFLSEKEIVFSEPKGVSIIKQVQSLNGFNSYSDITNNDNIDLNYHSSEGDFTTIDIIPRKAGTSKLNFYRNRKLIGSVSVKIESSAVFDKKGYPLIQIGELAKSVEEHLDKAYQVEVDFVAIEEGILIGQATEEDKKYFVAFDFGESLSKDGANALSFMDVYSIKQSFPTNARFTLYGKLKGEEKYKAENGLSYDMLRFEGLHIEASPKK